MNLQPLVSALSLDDTLAWRPDGPVTVRSYLSDALCVSGSLPAGDWVLNLCEDRYHFAVVFAACLLSGKTSLQPASQSAETLDRLAQAYPGVVCVTDSGDCPQPWLRQAPQGGASKLGSGPAFAHERPQPWLRQAPQGGASKLGSGPAFAHERPQPWLRQAPQGGAGKLGSGPAFPRETLAFARLNYADLANGPSVPVQEIPCIDAQRVVAILFTSGSTGLPQPHGKTWGRLVMNGRAEAQAMGLAGTGTALVGTVPVQHSYGFESTFLLALHGGCCFWSGKPFYPQDVVDALLAVPRPRMLVTTPHHLATLLATGLDMPALDACLSATAPLTREVAVQAEALLGAPVFEIYGSTESSQLASRRTVEGAAWQLLSGVKLEQESGDASTITHAVGGHVEGRVPLSDIIELLPLGRFHLNGRHADLVNIAGKRTSLAYLNHQLCAIDGVRDGAFFLPSHDATEPFTRLTAFVVAPGLSHKNLLIALRQRIDPIFLPRPLVYLEALPRNDTGKLPRSALESLYLQQVGHDAR